MGHPMGRGGPLRQVATDSPEMFAWIAMGAMKYATSEGVLPKFLDWLSEGQDQIDAELWASGLRHADKPDQHNANADNNREENQHPQRVNNNRFHAAPRYRARG